MCPKSRGRGLQFGEVVFAEHEQSDTSANYTGLSWKAVSQQAVIQLYEEDALHQEAPSRTYRSGQDLP